MAPAGSNISMEREVFPTLIGNGLFGYEADGYWLDIGTPERYLQGTYDILEGNVKTELGRRLGESGLVLLEGARILGRVVAPAIIGAGCEIAPGAIVGGRTVLGHGVAVGAGTHIESSVLLDGVRVGARSTVRGRSSVPGADRRSLPHRGPGRARRGCQVGPDNVLAAGARIFPGVELPEGAIKF